MVQSSSITADGYRGHFLELGTGEPVVLLHDIPGDARTWRYSVDVLATGFRVLAVDLPGWGKTAAPRHFVCSLEALAGHVWSLRQALGLERVSLVGLGVGGLVALEHAVRFPAQTHRLVVVGAPLRGTDPPLQVDAPSGFIAQQVFKQRLKARIQRVLQRCYTEKDGVPDDLVRGVARALAQSRTIRAVARGNAAVRQRLPQLAAELPSVTAPTLVVWGEKDAVAPREDAHFLAERVPNATMSLVPNAGHYCHDEMPAAFNSAVLNFLKQER